MDATKVSITPHTHDQLEMSNARRRGGWRLIFPPNRENGTATLCYVVDHGREGGYYFSVVSHTGTEKGTKDQWFGDYKPRSQGIDPPPTWPDMWERYKAGGTNAVMQSLQKIKVAGWDYE